VSINRYRFSDRNPTGKASNGRVSRQRSARKDLRIGKTLSEVTISILSGSENHRFECDQATDFCFP